MSDRLTGHTARRDDDRDRRAARCATGTCASSASACRRRPRTSRAARTRPNVVLIYESGTIGAKPDLLPLSIGDGNLADTADTVGRVPEIFNYWLQAGRVDVGFLGAAQVDRFGNINTTVIGGDYAKPKVRLPGAGGAPEIAASCREVLIIMRQSTRSFVERVDFVTSVGYGSRPASANGWAARRAARSASSPTSACSRPTRETCELTLTALHPGSHRRAGPREHRLGARGAPTTSPTTERADRRGAARPARAAEDPGEDRHDAATCSSWTPCAPRSAATAARWPGSARTTSPHTWSARSPVARPRLDPARIDDVYFGDANGGRRGQPRRRADGRAAGRPADVGARASRSTGCAARGWRRSIGANRAIAVGDASLAIAGGVESMSRAPWVLLKPAQGLPGRPRRRCTRPRWAGGWSTRRCRRTGPSRSASAPSCSPRSTASPASAQDAFALASHQQGRTRRGTAGALRRRGGAVPGVELGRDEGIRADASLRGAGQAEAGVPARTARSPPATPRRSTTARPRCCSATQRRRRAAGAQPLARIVSPRRRRGRAAVLRHRPGRRRRTPRCAGPASAGATSPLVELNEAFAAQSLACLAEWPDLDPAIVNVARRRDRDRPPARLLRRAASLGHLAHALHAPRRRLRPGRDLHRRRPGPRRRAGGRMSGARPADRTTPPMSTAPTRRCRSRATAAPRCDIRQRPLTCCRSG